MFTRIALRRLRSAPAFSATVIALVAIAVGSCVLLGTIASRTLLVPSTPHEPDRVIRIYTADETRYSAPSGRYGMTSLPDFREMERAAQGRATIAAFSIYPLGARVGTEEFSASTSMVTTEYFTVAGVQPLLGSVVASAEPGAIISYDLWVRRFARSQSVLGTPITLGKVTLPVRAVMPDGFFGTTHSRVTDAWVPTTVARAMQPDEYDPELYHDDRRFSVIGRLAPGTTLAESEPGLRAAALDLQKREAITNSRRVFLAVPFPRMVGEAEKASLGIDRSLLAAAVLVAALILLAYANVANLFAVQSLLAAREIAIRKALGGGNRELLADALGQVAFLVLPGVLLGWGLARVVFSVFFASNPIMAHDAMPFDALTMVVLLTLGLLGTVALGAVPAWWAHSQTASSALREADGDTPLRNARVLWGLVAVQVAIACVAGGLVYEGVNRVRELEGVVAGYALDRIIDGRIDLHAKGMGPAVHDEVRAFLARVERIEGVEAAATAEVPLLTGFSMRQAIGIAGRTFAPSEVPNVRFEVVSPDYFSTLGLRMERGGFSEGIELQDTFTEIVVNRAFADAFLPAGRELEQVVLLREVHPVRVAGVVQNSVTEALVEVEEPRIYMPHRRAGALAGFQLVLRTKATAAEAAPLIEEALRADRGIDRMGRVEPLTVRRERVIAPVRAMVMIFGVLGVAITALVTIGAYGLLAVSITSVRRSTAIRVALGAPPRRVVLACVRPLLIAFGFGVAGAIAITAASQRAGVPDSISPLGVLAALPFLAVPMVLAAAALLRRMLRRSPAEVLRI